MTINKNYDKDGDHMSIIGGRKIVRGRPRKEQSEKRSVILQIRVTEDERETVTKAAEAAGKTVTEWMREKIIQP